MTISRDDLQFCISKFLKFLLFSAWDFAKRRPFFSWTLLLFSFLYVLFPWFFWSLIYLSASSILIYSITRIYFSSQNKYSTTSDANRNANSVHSSKDIGLNVRNGRPIVRARSVRQRKSRDTSRNSSVQGSEDEKSTVISSTFNNDMVDKGPLIEENTKEIQEVKVDDKIIIHGECSTSNGSGGLKQELHGKSQPESQKFVKRIDSESESSEEDEQDREDNNKAVQWTEDDQKNLMDLGLSEIERNKRLESLIARRRAKKLLSLQIRRTLNKDIGLMAPIVIPEHKNYSQDQTTTQLSPMPGSAPSVLLPVHDPFDLPYDPLEEKPILTGGSFHQEFIAPEPKDTVFCRHESFCLGDPSPKEFKQDQQETKPQDSTNNKSSEGPENSDAGNQLEVKDTDKIIEMESCQSPKSNLKKIIVDHCNDEEIQRSEKGTILANIHQENPSANVETKTIMVDNPISKSGSTSSEEDVPLSRVDKEAILKSLASPHPRNISLDRDSTNQLGYALRSYGTSMMDKVMHHKPTYSIASDLQVEVSEVSSPPTVGSISSFDIGRPIEEDDITSDFPYENEVMWEISSQPSRNHEDDSKSSEICKLHEQNTTKFGFSRIEEPKDSVVSNEMAKVVKETEIAGSLVSGPNDELLNVSHEHMPGFHTEFKDKVQTSISETSQASTSGSSACLTGTSNSISVGLIGRQQEEKENHYNTADEKNKQIDKNDTSRTPNDTQRESERQIKVDESMSNEDINIVEPTATNEDGEHISEAGSSTNGSFTHQAPSLQPRTALEEAPMSSGIPSPKSVLQPKFSMDQLSSLDSSEDMHVDIHQVYTHTVETNIWDEARGATSISATRPGGTAPSEDSTSQSWLSQEESHPSTSAMKAQSHPLETSSSVTKDEKKLNETTTTPESSAARMSSPRTTSASENSTEEMNPSTLDNINDDKSEDPQKAVALPAFVNPSGQVNKLTSPLVNAKESFHPSTSSIESNSFPSSTEARYADSTRTNAESFHPSTSSMESDSTRTNTPDTTTALQKPVGETNASILVTINDKMDEPHEDTAQIALANLGEEVNKPSRPVFNSTESSHPSTSSVEANSFPSRMETRVVEHERTPNDTTKIPESTSTRTSGPEPILVARKPMEEAKPSNLERINNKPEDPRKHVAPSALANSNEEVDQLNSLLVNKNDSSSPSVSSMEPNSFPSTTQTKVVEHEKRQAETLKISESKISESTSTRISGPNTLAMLQKPMEETNPSTLGRINNQLEDPDEHAAPPTLANPNEQPKYLNRLLLHTEELARHSTSPMEVNSYPSSTESNVVEHERRQNENIENHERTSTMTGHADTVAAVQKPIKETNPSTSNKISDKSDGPREHVAPPAKETPMLQNLS